MKKEKNSVFEGLILGFFSLELSAELMSGVCLSVRKHGTNRNYWRYQARIRPGMSSGDPHRACQKLGQCDLCGRFYRPKFTFTMYSNGRSPLMLKLFKRESFSIWQRIIPPKDI